MKRTAATERARLFPLGPLLVLLLLTSCATTTLWGGSIHDDDDDGKASIHVDGGPEWEGSVWTRVLATPFAIVFDLCTLPIQAVMYGWDDDEDDDC